MRGRGYRLQYRLVTRLLWTSLLLVTLAFFFQVLLTGAAGFWWRVAALGVVANALAAIRVMWGPAVIVCRWGLRIYRPWWPLHRDIDWYRILAADIIPGVWFLDIEMNSGERIELPCVENMDDLFERIEHHRALLDQISD